MRMNSSHVELNAGLVDNGLKLNQDLANQINEMTSGPHSNSECWSSGRPMVIEALLWTLGGAILWVVTLYLAS
jgi:hypothetical protein